MASAAAAAAKPPATSPAAKATSTAGKQLALYGQSAAQPEQTRRVSTHALQQASLSTFGLITPHVGSARSIPCARPAERAGGPCEA